MKRTVSKAKFVLAMAVLFSHCHSLADEQFAEQLGPVAAALRSGNLGSALTLTNLLETLAYSSSSAEDAATCRIVETYILLDAAGSEADEKAFEKANGVTIPYEIKPRRAGDIATCYANPDKAKNELGWEAQYDLERMCKDSWNFTQKYFGSQDNA